MLAKNNSFKLTTFSFFGIIAFLFFCKETCMASSLKIENHSSDQDKRTAMLDSFTTDDLISLTVLVNGKFEVNSYWDLITTGKSIGLRELLIKNLSKCKPSLLEDKLRILRSYTSRIGQGIVFDGKNKYCYVVKEALFWKVKYKNGKKVVIRDKERIKIYFVLEEITKVTKGLKKFAQYQFDKINTYGKGKDQWQLVEGIIGFKDSLPCQIAMSTEKEKLFVLYATTSSPKIDNVKELTLNNDKDIHDDMIARINKAIMIVSILDPPQYPFFCNMGITRLYEHMQDNNGYEKYCLGASHEREIPLSMALHAMSTQMLYYYMKKRGYPCLKKEFMMTHPVVSMSSINEKYLGQQFVVIGDQKRRESYATSYKALMAIQKSLNENKTIEDEDIDQSNEVSQDLLQEKENMMKKKKSRVRLIEKKLTLRRKLIRKDIATNKDYVTNNMKWSEEKLKTYKNTHITPFRISGHKKNDLKLEVQLLNGEKTIDKYPIFLKIHQCFKFKMNASIEEVVIPARALASLLPTGDESLVYHPAMPSSTSSSCQII